MLREVVARALPGAGAPRRAANRLRPPWTLSTQFLLANLAVSIAGMLVIGLLVGRQIEEGVLTRTAAITALYVDSVVAPRLQGLASRSRLDASEVKTLTWQLTSTPLADRVVSFNVWSLNGEVLYSPDPPVIGKVFPIDTGIARASRGEVYVNMDDQDPPTNSYARQRSARLVDVYVPVRDGTQEHIIAVTEFYLRPDELEGAIDAARWRTWAVVAGTTLVWYLALAGIVGRGSNTIVRHERALREKVHELSTLLGQNRRLHERVRQAASRTTTLNEQALRRIGADLHDGPAQALALALLRLDAPALRNGDVAQRDQELATVQKAVQDALDEVRGIATGLRLPELVPRSVTEVVERAVQGHERRSGTTIQFDLDHVPDQAPLAVKIALVRALQEALSNATRHGGGVDVRVRAWAEGDHLHLIVSDWGPGFDPSAVQPAGRLGLAGMRERAELLGGGFRLDAVPGRGTTVHVRWPLAEGSEE